MPTFNSGGSALRFRLNPSIRKVHLDGQTYENGSLTKPLDVPLEVVTFDDDTREYPLGSAAVWARGTTLILTGPQGVSGNQFVSVIPERQLGDDSSASSDEHWTPADGQGIDPDLKDPVDAKKMLFQNWRCGPREIPQNMPIFNVLLKGYKRFGGMKPAEFVNDYYPKDTEGHNTNSIIWPDAKDGHPNGFLSATDFKETKLPVNTLLDRFGQEDTCFFGAIGVTFAQRTLPPASLDFLGRYTEADFRKQSTIDNSDQDMYRIYCVTKEFTAQVGPIAPSFGQPGAGIQIYATKEMNPAISVEKDKELSPKILFKAGYVRRLSWDEIEKLSTSIADKIDGDLAARDVHSAVMASTTAVLDEAGYSMPYYHHPNETASSS